MPHAKRLVQAAITIDGFSLIWRLHREQQLTTADGWQGVAIHVSVVEGVRRELHLEYPAVQDAKGRLLQNGFCPAKYLTGEGGSSYSAGDGGRVGPGVAGQAVCF